MRLSCRARMSSSSCKATNKIRSGAVFTFGAPPSSFWLSDRPHPYRKSVLASQPVGSFSSTLGEFVDFERADVEQAEATRAQCGPVVPKGVPSTPCEEPEIGIAPGPRGDARVCVHEAYEPVSIP